MPEPVIFLALEPQTDRDLDKLDEALELLSSKEPNLYTYIDRQVDRAIIAYSEEMDGFYLANLVAEVLSELKIAANISKPQAFYRATLRKGVTQEGKYIRQSSSADSYGHVVIKIEPGEPRSGVKFISQLVGNNVLQDYAESIEQGVRETCASSILAGYPVTDIIVTLVDGSYHAVDSHEMAFKFAATIAIREAVKKVQPVLLEPVMKVEIEVPHNYTNEVVRLLESLRCQIDRQELSGEIAKIAANVPRAEMFSFQENLDRLSQSRISCSMEFDRFEELPPDLAATVIADYERKKLQASNS
jgi:elongation factor G